MTKITNSILLTSVVLIATGCVGDVQPHTTSASYADKKSKEVSQKVTSKVDTKVDSAIDNTMNRVFNKIGL